MFSLVPDGKSVKILAFVVVSRAPQRNSFELRRKLPIDMNGATLGSATFEAADHIRAQGEKCSKNFFIACLNFVWKIASHGGDWGYDSAPFVQWSLPLRARHLVVGSHQVASPRHYIFHAAGFL